MSGQCPLCHTPIQRTPEGAWWDGLAEHYRYLHPDEELPPP